MSALELIRRALPSKDFNVIAKAPVKKVKDEDEVEVEDEPTEDHLSRPIKIEQRFDKAGKPLVTKRIKPLLTKSVQALFEHMVKDAKLNPTEANVERIVGEVFRVPGPDAGDLRSFDAEGVAEASAKVLAACVASNNCAVLHCASCVFITIANADEVKLRLAHAYDTHLERLEETRKRAGKNNEEK